MTTLLDNDLYKFTMMQAVWRKQREAQVRYRFINRRPRLPFTVTCVAAMRDQIHALADVRFTADELAYLRGLPFMQGEFVDFLAGFQLRADDVELELRNGELAMAIEGGWVDTILWEVPLLALVSENYFRHIDQDWDQDLGAYFDRAVTKGQRMTAANARFIEFGTRRRRNFATQETVVRAFNEAGVDCLGTSNVHFARTFGMKPVGTMAHEWIMGYAGLVGVEQANAKALQAWRDVYGEQLSVALTDTYTTDLFFDNLRGELAQAYAGMRHDSECPFRFADRVLEFYAEEGIDPLTKRIVFSDSLDVDKALAIQEHVAGRIPVSFGIGTHFTNDFAGSAALNIVIKLDEINGVKVAKLSDNPEKACGDKTAVTEAMKFIKAA
ncbi:nicotinate phosphoribosyltransferase [Cerasicoccus maritimus]|uniref:nicotinate phosphoribosyltransferase n=1 Tax=Cerasicoccus maritimus TaxID=490089 RepID=UPI002852D8B7|nr:nicotinate phosphoribosyltransferase [Cerasicoccus maritimus]